MNVVINNTYSSINLFDQYFQSNLANLIETLQANDTDIRVVVFSSANPDFFLSHVDFNLLTPGHGKVPVIFTENE
jgi:enoyl-CoA hydratase/carnithine racemase